MKITLANLATATQQQVFDQVAAHLLHQNAKSIKDGKANNCVYRGDNGLKCAAGCLISDDEYKPEMDKAAPEHAPNSGSSWPSLVARELVPCTEHNQFITILQELHDDHAPEHFKKELRRTAEEYGLKTDVLEKVTLANLEYKTAQEVFDQAAVHMLTQKEKSNDPQRPSRCLYRNPNGLKCAAGALIADHEYFEVMDKTGQSGWYSLVDRGTVTATHKLLIANLQSAHDNFNTLDELRISLCDVATKHELNTDAIKGM